MPRLRNALSEKLMLKDSFKEILTQIISDGKEHAELVESIVDQLLEAAADHYVSLVGEAIARALMVFNETCEKYCRYKRRR
jgi:L-lysine 2,3-aminomutase